MAVGRGPGPSRLTLHRPGDHADRGPSAASVV